MTRVVVAAAISVALAGCSSKRIPITVEPAGSVPVSEARETVRRTLAERGTPDAVVHRTSIQGTFGKTPARIPLEAPVTVLERQSNMNLANPRPYVIYDLHLVATADDKNVKSVTIPFNVEKQAMSFIRAFNELVALNRAFQDPRDFEARAAAWRASNPKPLLSEEGKKKRILAENAARENNPEAALRHYEAALETDPTWPDGNLNAALILGGMGDYGAAVHYLKRFLLLEPGSRDSDAARQKLVIWEDKAGK